MFLTIFIDLLGFGIIIPILPNYVKGLTGSDIMVGFTAAIYSIMQFIFTPVWGALSDRYGRRPIILFSIVGSVISYFIFSFASTLPVLLLSRSLSGIGSGNISAAQAYISDITEPKDRAKSMGLIGAAFGLGFIIGPSIGGFLMSQFGFSSIGYFCSALCLLNLILAYFILPESIKEKNLHSPIRILPFHEYKAVFHQPIHSRLFLINFIYISAFFFFQITSPLLWKERYGFNETQIGLVLSFVGISTALVQGLLVGLLNKFFSEQTMLRAGTVILSLAVVSVPFIPAEFFWLLIFPIIFLIALSGGFIGPSNLALISKTTASQEQGKTLGLFQSFGSLARVFGPLVGSTLYGVTYYFPYVAGLTILIINLFLFILPLNRLLNKNKSDVAG